MRLVRLAVTVTVLTALAGSAGAVEIVVPVFAFDLPGHSRNLWTTELYLANPTGEPILVDPPLVLEGSLEIPNPCYPPIRQKVVPPFSSVVWTAEEIAFQLGCATQVIGALLLSADGPLVVDSRVVNVSGEYVIGDGADEELPEVILSGFSQQMPGIPVVELPGSGDLLMLPSLVWHPGPCGAVAFDSYVGLVNPTGLPMEVVFDLDGELRGDGMILAGTLVTLPHTVTIPPRSWQQLHVAPPPSDLTVCGEPRRFDLFVKGDGPLAAYGSVVDRSTQDPRTVFPVPLHEEPARTGGDDPRSSSAGAGDR